MASINIHLAIAKKYMELNEIKDVESFIKGSIAPDVADDKMKSHYSKNLPANNLKEKMYGKVCIDEYLSETHEITDYEVGLCLHLLTDYVFFTEFIDTDYLMTHDFSTFTSDLYYSYDLLDPLMEEEYDILSLKKQIGFQEKMVSRDVKKKYAVLTVNDNEIENLNRVDILPIQEIRNFIDYMANMDIMSLLVDKKIKK